MSKNEYRRAFIMLRPAMAGYSGHVRLERRTMTGSMYFIVSAREAQLQAALVGQRGGEYYAAPLGTLRRDARGQLTLASAFDPRNIDGRPLEAYPMLVIVRTDDGCQVVLTGNVDGAHKMDAEKVGQTVCAIYATDEPAADLPEVDEPVTEAQGASGAITAEETATVQTGEAVVQSAEPATDSDAAAPAECEQADGAAEPDAATPDPASEPESDAPSGPLICVLRQEELDAALAAPPSEADTAKTRIYTRMRARAAATTAAPDSSVTPAAETSSTAKPAAVTVASEATTVSTAPTDAPAATTSSTETTMSAAATGTDGSAVAIQCCKMPLEDGYTYMRAPLPSACGMDECLLGVRMREGRIVSMRCALPGLYAPEPPEGMEGTVWVSPADGSLGGFWIYTADMD